MWRLVLTVIAVVLLVVPAQAKHKHHATNTQNHKAVRLRNGAWDPGYTYSNPYGMPPWLRAKPH